MPILTKTQKESAESRALAVLKQLVRCKQRKDMLEKAEIWLGRNREEHALYLTRKGLMEQEGESMWRRISSLELVQEFSLSAPDLERALRELKSSDGGDKENEDG